MKHLQVCDVLQEYLKILLDIRRIWKTENCRCHGTEEIRRWWKNHRASKFSDIFCVLTISFDFNWMQFIETQK